MSSSASASASFDRRVSSRSFGLYLVMTEPVVGYDRCTAAAVEAQVAYVQLRAKNRPRSEVVAIGRRLRAITAGTATRLIVNDDVMAAAEIDADGVHLGQDDMSLAEARATWSSAGKLFGLSTHNEAQARAAEASSPDYIGVGPVFATPSKAIADPVLGPRRASAIVQAATEAGLTPVAIGGLDLSTMEAVAAEGVLNFALIRAVGLAEDPSAAIRQLQRRWQELTTRHQEQRAIEPRAGASK